MFLSTNKKVTGVWNSEVGSRKSMEKTEDIQFHPWNTTYIFTAVKIQLLIFSRLWNTAFLKYALYLIIIFLYFITLYIIKIYCETFFDLRKVNYSKSCLKQPPKKEDPNLVFKTNNHLMQVKVLQNALLEHSAILSTLINFYHLSLFCLFFGGRLRQVLLYSVIFMINYEF